MPFCCLTLSGTEISFQLCHNQLRSLQMYLEIFSSPFCWDWKLVRQFHMWVPLGRLWVRKNNSIINCYMKSFSGYFQTGNRSGMKTLNCERFLCSHVRYMNNVLNILILLVFKKLVYGNRLTPLKPIHIRFYQNL